MQKLYILVLIFSHFLIPIESWSKDSDDSLFSKIKAELITPSNAVLEQKEWGLNVINNLANNSQEFFELKKKEVNAPRRALFRATRGDVRIDISKILDDLEDLLFEEEINDFIQEKVDYLEEIDELNDEIAELKSINLTLPEKGTTFRKGQDDVLEEINSKLYQIASYENEISRIYQNIAKNYRTLGISLDMDVIENLTNRIDGTDIMENVEMFNALKVLLPLLTELMETNKENYSFTKKYYGVYVLLTEVAIFTQEQSLIKNIYEYSPQLEKITLKIHKSLNNIEMEISQLKKPDYYNDQLSKKNLSRIEKYRKNQDAHKVTLETINIYRTMLTKREGELSQSIKESRKDLRLAYSSYETVVISSEFLNLIQNSDKWFQNTMQMQIPEMLPFENELMTERFKEITMQMKESI